MTAYPLEPLIDITDPAVMMQRAQACGTARGGGWFWLPCPLCGLEFGGQESMRGSDEKPSAVHMDGQPPDTARGICPFCTMAGRGADPRWAWAPVLAAAWPARNAKAPATPSGHDGGSGTG